MVGGCGAPPLEVVHLERLDPPASYRVWWDELERCVGLAGDFEGIEWFTGDAVRLEGDGVFGAWQAPRTIVVKRFYSTSQLLVKHEMLHYLTRGDMPHTHPAFANCT